MINKFCRLLSHGLLFTNAGSNEKVKYKPCCHFTMEKEISTKESFDKYRQYISSIQTWTPYCQKCKNFEENGVESTRIKSNNEIKNQGFDIEIQIDNTCNAACITCNEWLSTTWKKYNNRINGKSTYYISNLDLDNNFSKIIKVLDLENIKINSINFYGGEPFATDTHLKFLSKIPANKYKEIELSYNTNGSYFIQDTTLNTLGKFKKVDFSFSLDGIENVFEYHRWPLSWKNVSGNFDRLLTQKDQKNFSIDVGCTLTPLNILYFKDLEIWIKNKVLQFEKNINFEFWPAFGVMSLSGINSKYRIKLNEIYNNNTKLIGYINSQPYTDYAYNELIKHLEFNDKHRKLNWRETFPEIKIFLDH